MVVHPYHIGAFVLHQADVNEQFRLRAETTPDPLSGGDRFVDTHYILIVCWGLKIVEYIGKVFVFDVISLTRLSIPLPSSPSFIRWNVKV